jgi:hypothetical protein
MADPISDIVVGIVKGLGDTGLNWYNNEDNQNLQRYLATKSLQDQKDIQQQLIDAKTQAQKQVIAQQLVNDARRKKNMPYYVVGGILGVTLIVGLLVLFSKK